MKGTALAVLLLCGACGEVRRPIGKLDPSLGQGGDAGASGAPSLVERGSPDDLSRPWQSSGCGEPLPPEQVTTVPGSREGYTEWHVQQTGATLGELYPAKADDRQFFVRVPADYDPARPYRVVYVLQGCGEPLAGDTSTYPLFDERRGGSEQAVYVAVSVPENDDNPGCYDVTTGPRSQEWEAFELIHDFVESRYCVDNNRIYVAGFDSGATLANMWGCYFGGQGQPPRDDADVSAGRQQRRFAPSWAIRGHAAVGDTREVNQPVPCNGPSAGIWIHDADDHVNLLTSSANALYLNLLGNGCTSPDSSNNSVDTLYEQGPKRNWAPADDISGLEAGICQEYTGCPAAALREHPVVFCTTHGEGHDMQISKAVPAFTQFFASLEAN